MRLGPAPTNGQFNDDVMFGRLRTCEAIACLERLARPPMSGSIPATTLSARDRSISVLRAMCRVIEEDATFVNSKVPVLPSTRPITRAIASAAVEVSPATLRPRTQISIEPRPRTHLRPSMRDMPMHTSGIAPKHIPGRCNGHADSIAVNHVQRILPGGDVEVQPA